MLEINEINDPKVTVVIPCYNDGKYLQDAVNSILAQTFTDFKIIIIDDGSTDEYTNRVLQNFDSHKISVISKENGGVSSARNLGISKTNSKYILVLDADDYFDKFFLEKAVSILEKSEDIGVVTCYYKPFDIPIWQESKTKKVKGGTIKDFLLGSKAIGNSLFRRECWEETGGYDENLVAEEDWEFWINVAKRNWKIYSIPEVLFYHRYTNKSLHKKHYKTRDQRFKYIVEKHKDVYEKYAVTCINELFKRNHISYLNITNSMSFKIGNKLVKPFKITYSFITKLLYSS